MARPGIMLYFDILEPIRVLPDADKGRLLVAMLEYGKDATVPRFEGMLALAWGFVRPKIDRDREEYERTVLRRQYAVFCRERKRKNEADIGFEQWLRLTGNQEDQLISHDAKDDQWYPAPTAATAPSITPSVTAAAAEPEAAAAAAERKLKMMGGALGKGVVLLTDEQIGDLLDRLGLEVFDHYVDKLSTFIVNKGARVASHYDTILKWWMQDSGLREERR